MATTLAATIRAGVSWVYTNVLTGATIPDSNSFTYLKKLTDGTGALGTADLIYAIKTTIAASGNLSMDLYGSLANFFGTTMSMARVKVMYVNLTADTTASSIAIGNHAAPLINWISAATATVKVNNDGLFVLGSGNATSYAVTNTTADGLMILNNDGANVATVKVVVIGSTA